MTKKKAQSITPGTFIKPKGPEQLRKLLERKARQQEQQRKATEKRQA